MNRLHAARHLDLGAQALPPGLAFAGDAQDLEEMLGNLLDNACRHARSAVEVQASREGGQLVISVDDDGPGIPEAQRARVLQRGVRLEVLARADAGGLRARLLLPAAG
ncbi:ATP-binding protein [Piscinibacter sakaiensis]|uniref:ATP-binding protein n=1 Tax=Piscinibacter sakaiensis TaxID=1547922 RepID=UPI003726BF9B